MELQGKMRELLEQAFEKFRVATREEERESAMAQICEIAQQHPQMVTADGEFYRSPFLNACSEGHIGETASLEVVEVLLQASLRAEASWEGMGYTPLHQACMRRHSPVDVEVVKLLADAYPEAVTQLARSGALPIHFCCSSPRSLHATKELIRRFPDSVVRLNGLKETPLHRLLREGYKQRNPREEELIEILNCMVAQDPSVLGMQNPSGHTALHLSLNTEDVHQVFVEQIMSLSPESLETADNEGAVPLHIACQHQLCGLIPGMVQRCSESLKARDQQGRTPLHDFCWSVSGEQGDDEALLRPLTTLVEAWPLATICTDQHGDLPYQDLVAGATHNRNDPCINFLLTATRHMVVSLAEGIFRDMRMTHIWSSLRAILHVLPHGDVPGSAFWCDARNQLAIEDISDILGLEGVQDWINSERVQNLICGLNQMHHAGRSYVRENASDVSSAARVIEAVSSNLDCLWIHVRENPEMVVGW